MGKPPPPINFQSLTDPEFYAITPEQFDGMSIAELEAHARNLERRAAQTGQEFRGHTAAYPPELAEQERIAQQQAKMVEKLQGKLKLQRNPENDAAADRELNKLMASAGAESAAAAEAERLQRAYIDFVAGFNLPKG